MHTCPVCKKHDQYEIDLHSDGFYENILECKVCGMVWSVNHGLIEIVKDPQEKSFLGAACLGVEGDDCYWAA